MTRRVGTALGVLDAQVEVLALGEALTWLGLGLGVGARVRARVEVRVGVGVPVRVGLRVRVSVSRSRRGQVLDVADDIVGVAGVLRAMDRWKNGWDG